MLAVTVRFARLVSVVPKSKIAPLELTVVVPVLKLIVLVFPLLDSIDPAVKLYVARLNDPFVTVSADDPIFKALPRTHSQSTPFTVIADANVTPFVVNVNPVELLDSVMLPVYVRVRPVAGSVTLPWMPTIAAVPANVTFPDAGPAIVSDFILMPPVTVSTVAV